MSKNYYIGIRHFLDKTMEIDILNEKIDDKTRRFYSIIIGPFTSYGKAYNYAGSEEFYELYESE